MSVCAWREGEGGGKHSMYFTCVCVCVCVCACVYSLWQVISCTEISCFVLHDKIIIILSSYC